MTKQNACPCGSKKSYEKCCGVYHMHVGSAPTAEALMRSRYSAFALNKIDYILATQQLSEAAPERSDLENENNTTQWVKLEILETENGQVEDETGTVTFRAHFQEGKHQGELSEKSNFEKRKGQWFYVSGSHDVKTREIETAAPKTVEPKVGRNDPCPCGSGKKFKKCCG